MDQNSNAAQEPVVEILEEGEELNDDLLIFKADHSKENDDLIFKFVEDVDSEERVMVNEEGELLGDLDSISSDQIGKCVMHHNGQSVSVHYNKEAVTPRLMVFQVQAQKAQEEQERVAQLNKKLDSQAKRVAEKRGITFDDARKLVVERNQELKRQLVPKIEIDIEAMIDMFVNLVVWTGWTSKGKPIPSDRDFFMNRTPEFITNMMEAINKSITDPLGQSEKESSNDSSSDQNTEVVRQIISSIEQPNTAEEVTMTKKLVPGVTL